MLGQTIGRGSTVLAIALGVLLTQEIPPAGAAGGCDTELVRARAARDLPGYSIDDIRLQQGVVTLLFGRRDGPGSFAVALHAVGTRLSTSVKNSLLDEAELSHAMAPLQDWWKDHELQAALVACSEAASSGGDDPSAGALRDAVDGVLREQEGRGPRSLTEPLLSFGGLLLSLGIALWPAVGGVRSPTRPRTSRLDLVLLLLAALVGVAVATQLAWRVAPEGDETVTLASRHAPLSQAMAWNDGREPFSPPGAPTLFALWLRLADGFFWARLLSLALVPLTVLAAYRAGRGFANRFVGVVFAVMIVTAPTYLRLASIARAYSLIAFALCLILAAIAGTRESSTRGATLGVASLVGLWVSYLLWPLAVAAPWLARLQRRDRRRVFAAVAVSVAVLMPRVVSGIHSAQSKSGSFQLPDARAAFEYAWLAAAQSPTLGLFGQYGDLVTASRNLATLLLVAAVLVLWRSDRRLLRDVILVVILLALPVLALLRGGLGIRDRHVLGLQIGVTLVFATGVGMSLSLANWRWRVPGGLLATALLVGSLRGNRVELGSHADWMPDLAAMLAPADLVVIVPEPAQSVVQAMLSGDVPLPQPVRWAPLCPRGREPSCNRVQGKIWITTNRVDDELVAAAARSGRSVWIFSGLGGEGVVAGGQPIAPAMQRCARTFSNEIWSVFDCPRGGPPA